MLRNKKMVAMKLSERTRDLIAMLAARHDVSHTALVEAAVREKAEREGVTVREAEKSEVAVD